MDYRTAFVSKYISAVEIAEGKTRTVKIAKVEVLPVEDENGNARPRLVVSIEGSDRAWIVNRTNAELIAAMFGSETTAWHGKRVVIARESVRFGGQTVDGIRVVGSQDIAKDVQAVVKLPRKRPQTVTLKKAGVT